MCARSTTNPHAHTDGDQDETDAHEQELDRCRDAGHDKRRRRRARLPEKARSRSGHALVASWSCTGSFDDHAHAVATNGIMHAFSEFPMGAGAWIAGPFMATGTWAVPYLGSRSRESSDAATRMRATTRPEFADRS